MKEALAEYSSNLLAVTLLAIVVYALEWWRPADPHQTWRNRVANYAYLFVSLTVLVALNVLTAPLVRGVLLSTNGGILAVRIGHDSVAGEVAFALAFALSWDLWQYWIHRWQHTSQVLWETHKLHHSDAHLNGSTQGRHHVLSHILNYACWLPMIALFGAIAPHAIAGVILFRVWGFVNHANVRVSFGPLTSVIAGPQWHRIHHSTRREHFSKNFATFFPFIDRLFGTYYEPARDEYPPTGLDDTASMAFTRLATWEPVAGWWGMVLQRRYNA